MSRAWIKRRSVSYLRLASRHKSRFYGIFILVAVLSLFGSGQFPRPAIADSRSAVSSGSCGTVLLAGSAWLGGHGVDVRSNGPHQGTGTACGGTNYVGGVPTGRKWQCAELVNRLYLSREWISARWPGNGGRSSPGARDSMFDEAPAALSKEPNGSVTFVAPGDVVSINEYRSGAFQQDGHVMVVSTVSGSSVTLVGQNGGDPASATITKSATLTGENLTIPRSGSWTYSVIGVVHAPDDEIQSGSADFNGDGKSDLAFFNPGAGFAVAYGTATGFREVGRYLTNWGTPTWGAGGSFPGQIGVGFPK